MSTSSARLTVPNGPIWVCVDCAIMEANGELLPDRDQSQPAPWSLWADEPAGSVTLGGAEHGDWCTLEAAGECDCDHIDFSTSRCDGCGSSLAGAREAATYWTAS